MFDILRKSFHTGVVTTRYPDAPAAVSGRYRGKPEIDFSAWRDARLASAVCPTGAICHSDHAQQREVTFDLGKCVFCSLCAETDPAIRITNKCELATLNKSALLETATFDLKPDGTQKRLVKMDGPAVVSPAAIPLDALGKNIREHAIKMFGRSLHIREVDAGSCNGCELEIVGLNNPIYDIERFGIHFVASPRHADMLLVTGPVTRNMELALRKTYDATPDPRWVVAVGACGCSGGIFGTNYATVGAVDQVIPVDVYIPGCPPNPHALLHGILLAMQRNTSK